MTIANRSQWLQTFLTGGPPPALRDDEVWNSTTTAIVSSLWSFVRDDEMFCYPSHSTIAERAGCTRETVLKHLGVLEAHGCIEVSRLPHNVSVIRLRRDAFSWTRSDAEPAKSSPSGHIEGGVKQIDTSVKEIDTCTRLDSHKGRPTYLQEQEKPSCSSVSKARPGPAREEPTTKPREPEPPESRPPLPEDERRTQPDERVLALKAAFFEAGRRPADDEPEVIEQIIEVADAVEAPIAYAARLVEDIGRRNRRASPRGVSKMVQQDLFDGKWKLWEDEDRQQARREARMREYESAIDERTDDEVLAEAGPELVARWREYLREKETNVEWVAGVEGYDDVTAYLDSLAAMYLRDGVRGPPDDEAARAP